MIPQDVAATLNVLLTPIFQTLNLAVALYCVLATSPIVYILGKRHGRGDATREVQHALDRAARDIRLFARNGTHGVNYGFFTTRVLGQAEGIVRWRSLGLNYLEKPSGVPRTPHPNMPRSQWLRQQRDRAQQRCDIIGYGYQVHTSMNDTYAGTARQVMHARYN